jgi:hypothetical protein
MSGTSGSLYDLLRAKLRTFTVGSVLFVGANKTLAEDNPNFFWNDTTNRLGLGTALPAANLDVRAGVVTNISTIRQSTASTGYYVDYISRLNFGLQYDIQLTGVSILRASQNVASFGFATTSITTKTTPASRIEVRVSGMDLAAWDVYGRLGQGTLVPTYRLHVVSEQVDVSLQSVGAAVQMSHESPTGGTLRLLKSRGTALLPTAVASGDDVGHVAVQGYDGAGYSSGAYIKFTAAEAWTAAARGIGATLSVTPVGAVVGQVAVKVAPNGNVCAPAGSLGTRVRGSYAAPLTGAVAMAPNDATVVIGDGAVATLADPVLLSGQVVTVHNAGLTPASTVGHVYGTPATTLALGSRDTFTFQSDGTTWFRT